MQVKKFRAKTIKAATVKVKKALGPNAMIISTSRLTQSGAGNLFEIAAVPAGGDSFNENKDPFGQVQSELMSIKEMICLLNQSGGVLEKLIANPDPVCDQSCIKIEQSRVCYQFFQNTAGLIQKANHLFYAHQL
jgi:flagellar biosynthesis GTPase FlhF